MPRAPIEQLVQAAAVTAEELEACIEQACRICATPAPTSAEGERAALVAAELSQLGFALNPSPVGNVVARTGPGSAIAVAAHLDTVFAGVAEITPRREGSLVYGPGIMDNAVGLAALLHLARRLATRPAGAPIVLATTVGEEGRGDLRGARELVEREAPAEFIALEGADLGELIFAGPGAARYMLEVQGPGGHSWRDAGRPSATHVLVAMLDAFLALPGEHRRNVGIIAGGSTVNAIAASAQAEIEIRALDEASLEAAAQATLALIEGYRRAEPQLTITSRPVGRRAAGATARTHPLVATVEAAREALDLAAPTLRQASTDANAAMAHGIASVTLGVASGDHGHTLDEYADLTHLESGLALLETVVRSRAQELGP